MNNFFQKLKEEACDFARQGEPGAKVKDCKEGQVQLVAKTEF